MRTTSIPVVASAIVIAIAAMSAPTLANDMPPANKGAPAGNMNEGRSVGGIAGFLGGIIDTPPGFFDPNFRPTAHHPCSYYADQARQSQGATRDAYLGVYRDCIKHPEQY
jgi:hypothetical protein